MFSVAGVYLMQMQLQYIQWLCRLGQCNALGRRIEDGEVLPDEDVSQDPERLRAALAEAGVAAVGVLWRGRRQLVGLTAEPGKVQSLDSTDLRDVSRGRDGEGLAVEGEGDSRHALDVLAAHGGLWEEQQKLWDTGFMGKASHAILQTVHILESISVSISALTWCPFMLIWQLQVGFTLIDSFTCHSHEW